MIARRRDRQRLPAPLVHALHRLVGGELEHARGLGAGQRLALERDLEHDPQRAQRSGNEPRHVEAGDVFHDPAAKRQVVAAAVEQAHAQDEIAHRPGVRPPRSRQSGGDAAAERRRRAELRRLESEHLPGAAQRLDDRAERCAAARGDDELGRIVVDDAGVAERLERAPPAAPGRRSPWCRGRRCAAGSCAAAARRTRSCHAASTSLTCATASLIAAARHARAARGRARARFPAPPRRPTPASPEVPAAPGNRRPQGPPGRRRRSGSGTRPGKEGVGRRERAAQEIAALSEARAAFAPELDDAGDVGGRRRGGRLRPPQPHVHAQLVAQAAEAGMHFRGRRACPRPRRGGGRPHARMPLGEILGDRERVPDDARRRRAGTARDCSARPGGCAPASRAGTAPRAARGTECR